MPSRRILLAYAIVALIGLGRVAATHRVFSEVLDEPIHILAGYEWLKGIGYTMDASHPPAQPHRRRDSARDDRRAGVRGRSGAAWKLAAVLASTLRAQPRERAPSDAAVPADRDDRDGGVDRALLRPRCGGARDGDVRLGFPPLLGHSGLVTTNAPVAAMIPVALLAFDWWLDAPTWKRSIVLGIAIGLGALTKFSFVVFFPVSAVVIALVRWVIGGRPSHPPSAPSPPLQRGERALDCKPLAKTQSSAPSSPAEAGRRCAKRG